MVVGKVEFPEVFLVLIFEVAFFEYFLVVDKDPSHVLECDYESSFKVIPEKLVFALFFEEGVLVDELAEVFS